MNNNSTNNNSFQFAIPKPLNKTDNTNTNYSKQNFQQFFSVPTIARTPFNFSSSPTPVGTKENTKPLSTQSISTSPIPLPVVSNTKSSNIQNIQTPPLNSQVPHQQTPQEQNYLFSPLKTPPTPYTNKSFDKENYRQETISPIIPNISNFSYEAQATNKQIQDESLNESEITDDDIEYPLKTFQKLLKCIDNFENDYIENEASKEILVQKIKSYEIDLSNRDGIIKTLQHDKHMLVLKFNDISIQFNKITAELKSNSILVTTTNELLNDLEEKRDLLLNTLDQIESNNRESIEFIHGFKTRIEIQSNQIISQEELIKEKTENEQNYIKEIEDIRLSYEKEIKDFQDKVLKQKLEYNQLESEVKVLLKKKSSVESDLTGKIDDLEKQTKKNESLTNQVSSLSNECHTLKELNIDKENENLKLKSELEETTNKLDQVSKDSNSNQLYYENQRALFESDREDFEIEKERLSETIKNQSTELCSLNKEKENLISFKDNFHQMELIVQQLTEKNNYLNEKLVSANDRILYLEKDAEIQFEENKKITNEMNSLENEIITISYKLSEKDLANQSYLSKISDLELNLDKSIKDRELQSKKLAEKNNQIDIINERCNQLKLEKEKMSEQIFDLQTKMADQKSKEFLFSPEIESSSKNDQQTNIPLQPLHVQQEVESVTHGHLDIVPYHPRAPSPPLPDFTPSLLANPPTTMNNTSTTLKVISPCAEIPPPPPPADKVSKVKYTPIKKRNTRNKTYD